jgi:alpha-amylase
MSRFNVIFAMITLLFASTLSANPVLSNKGAALALPGWNWRSVINQIEAIKAFGFSAILLPPHTATCSGAFGGLGYDPSDFTSFDGGFGSASELQELIQLAHAAGIRVYADVIMNHMCTGNEYRYNRFSWPDFHHNGPIERWDDPFQLENHDLVGLNDLAQESPYVRRELDNYLRKTNNMGFDGFRLDGVKHVPHWYWRDHVTSITSGWGKFTVGEVYDANIDLVRSYAELGMSVTDFNLYFTIAKAFKYDGDLGSLDGAGYAGRDSERAVTFVENHDVPAPTNRLLAYAFLAGYPGYPFFLNIDLNDEQFKRFVWIKNNLANGAYINRWRERNLLIFEREGNLLVAINQSGSQESRWVDSSWVSTRLHDYSGNAPDTETYADKRVLVTIPPMSYVMLAPKRTPTPAPAKGARVGVPRSVIF